MANNYELLELEGAIELEGSVSDELVETADHSDFLELARELIAEDGRVVTFAIIPNLTSDPEKPWRGSGAQPPGLAFEVEVHAVFVPLSSASSLGIIMTDTSLFKDSEQVLLVAPPVTGERLSLYHIVVDSDGSRWKINYVMELRPASLRLLYAVGVTR